MSHQAASNGGFRWQEISRARFQETTASILGQQKQTADELATKVKAQGEFIADMSMRLDEHAKQLAIHRASFDAWGARTFVDRLRWLLTGK
jgi:hypothetical protein